MSGQPDADALETVLLVPSVSIPSGVVTYVLGVARTLEPMRCAVVAEAGSALAQALPPGCRWVPTSPGALGLTLALQRHRSRFGFVQAHGPRALLAARLAGITSPQLGYVFHEIDGTRAKSELRLARGARTAANGPATADWAQARLGTKVATLPPTVDVVEPLPRLDARAQLDVSAQDVVVGVVGRLSRVKWPLLAIEAVARSRLPATVVFVGDGPERQAILSAARHHGVRAQFSGSIVSANRLMTAFDVVLSCSPRETFGLAAAEAIIAGAPVVAVDSPGLRELSDQGRLLRLVPPIPDAVAAELKSTLSGRTQSRELRAHVLREFGVEASSVRLRRYYGLALTNANR
jgi:glycosyltransferase involved in cell wall biosynthesis